MSSRRTIQDAIGEIREVADERENRSEPCNCSPWTNGACDLGTKCCYVHRASWQQTNEPIIWPPSDQAKSMPPLVKPTNAKAGAADRAQSLAQKLGIRLGSDLSELIAVFKAHDEMARRLEAAESRTDKTVSNPVPVTTDEAHRAACRMLSELGVFSLVRVDKLSVMLREYRPSLPECFDCGSVNQPLRCIDCASTGIKEK